MNIAKLGSTIYTTKQSTTPQKMGANGEIASNSDVSSNLEDLAKKYDLKNITGQDIQHLGSSLFAAGKIDNKQLLTMMVMGISPTGVGGDPAVHNVTKDAHQYLEWASKNEPQTAVALQGLIGTFQTMTRLRDGHPADHWTA